VGLDLRHAFANIRSYNNDVLAPAKAERSFPKARLDAAPDLVYALFERTFERFLPGRRKSMLTNELDMRIAGLLDGNRLEIPRGKNGRGRRG
jgi:hypothetical protein